MYGNNKAREDVLTCVRGFVPICSFGRKGHEFQYFNTTSVHPKEEIEKKLCTQVLYCVILFGVRLRVVVALHQFQQTCPALPWTSLTLSKTSCSLNMSKRLQVSTSSSSTMKTSVSWAPGPNTSFSKSRGWCTSKTARGTTTSFIR